MRHRRRHPPVRVSPGGPGVVGKRLSQRHPADLLREEVLLVEEQEHGGVPDGGGGRN